MPLVRLPAERTKVGTMGLPLNKYRLEMSLSLIFLKFRSEVGRPLKVLQFSQSTKTLLIIPLSFR